MQVRGKWARWVLLAVLVALLIGRWLAVSTADRLWAESLGVTEPHVEIARLRLLISAAAMLFAIAWCVAHLFLVFRTIGSVNVPRRLGNLEFLETLPRRYLDCTKPYASGAGCWTRQVLRSISRTRS